MNMEMQMIYVKMNGFEFGKVDHILQKLSLRNLKYPIDADFGNTQDYMQINQFTYKPVKSKLFFQKAHKKKNNK